MYTKSNFELVQDFHEKFQVQPLASPDFTLQQLKDFLERRQFMLVEEVVETALASDNANLVEVIDGLLDVIYVAYGTLDMLGIDANAAFQEVHRSNMSKLGEDGQPIFDENLKVKKGPNFSRPNLKEYVAQALTGFKDGL